MPDSALLLTGLCAAAAALAAWLVCQYALWCRYGRKPVDPDKLSFWEHVDQIRQHLIWCVAGVGVGSVIGWYMREWLLECLRRPAELGAKRAGIEELQFRVFEPAGGFMIAIQVALGAGLIGAAPFILWQLWHFIRPGFHPHELRYSRYFLPAAIILFMAGVWFCYYVSPNAFAFLFRIDLSLGVQPERTLGPYLWFMVRLMLAFGLAFELPLFMVFLGYLGLTDSRRLLAYWRHAVVIVFAFAAVVTPTVDPVNMTILAAPMMVLYFLSVLLVYLFPEASAKRRAAAEQAAQTPTTTVSAPQPSAAPTQAQPDPTAREYAEARARETETEDFYRQQSGQYDSEADVAIPDPHRPQSDTTAPTDADSSEGLPPV